MDEVVTVDDAEMIAAVRWLFHEAHVVAEPSGAAATAAALRAGSPGAVAVVSGGNVDPAVFAELHHVKVRLKPDTTARASLSPRSTSREQRR